MSTIAVDLEAAPEYEDEFQLEWEGEGEEFLSQLAGLTRRAVSSPRLRRAARAAARSVGGGLGDVGAALGGRPGTLAAGVGGAAGAALGRILADLFPRSGDPEGEWESEANPIRRVYPDVLMEHLAHRAVETESEAEAEALVGALIPLAARLIPRAAPAVMRAAPQLARGIARATRVLRADRATRPLVRAVPQIVRRTATSLARQASRGQPVTPRRAVATLARQTAQTLSSPQQCLTAVRRSRSLDRTYHRQVRASRAGRGTAGAAVATDACLSCGR